MAEIQFLIVGTMGAATVFLLAALGELVAERSGMLNLGVEGMMAIGAAVGFLVTFETGNHVMGFLAAGAAGILLSLIFAIIAITFLTNQVVSGLAVGILGLGLSAILGASYEGFTVLAPDKVHIPFLSEIEFIGPAFFQNDLMVYITLGIAIVIGFLMKHSKLGLMIRASGENPQAAQALGYSVVLIRYCAVCFGGLLAGLSGAYASTIFTPLWSDGMIAGRGWIAVALVVFGTWKVGRLIFGAYLFGFVSLGELIAQAFGWSIPSQFLSSLPYIITIIVLAGISKNAARLRLHVPFSLGETFDKNTN